MKTPVALVLLVTFTCLAIAQAQPRRSAGPAGGAPRQISQITR